MTKRTQHIESDEPNTDELEDVTGDALEQEWIEKSGSEAVYYEEKQLAAEDSPFQRLLDSGVVTAVEGAISWREGHLEHVAKLYASNPVQTWRDYADDLTVALLADGSNFAALVERARGE